MNQEKIWCVTRNGSDICLVDAINQFDAVDIAANELSLDIMELSAYEVIAETV